MSRSLREVPERDGPAVLAIESSCDETSAAVLRGTRHLLSNVIHSQVAIHARYGGVVPELASRSHILAIGPIVEQALREAGVRPSDIAGVVATSGPGLVGSLLVGTEFAKGFALAGNVPLVGVNHLEGHLMAPRLGVTAGFDEMSWPLVALIVSGGHTSLVRADAPGRIRTLGQTLDDAAGEAFDKVSKQLGLGYPGGAVIEQMGRDGDPRAIGFPRPLMNRADDDFSFSGIKTAVAYWIRDHGVPEGQARADLCASFQAAVVDVLTTKLIRAATREGVDCVVVTGGVACNGALRASVAEAARRRGMRVSIPPPVLCTDNAGMIGAAGYARVHGEIEAGRGFVGWALNPRASWPLDVVDA